MDPQNGNEGVTQPDISEQLTKDLERLSGEKKYKWLSFQCSSTVEYLSTFRQKVKDVEGFWLYTLLSHVNMRQIISGASDRDALKYLTDIELKQDPKDPRPFELVFHFKENPYFENSTLSKSFALKEGIAKAPEDGSITDEMCDFDFDHLKPTAITIDWKSDDKNLVRKQPRAHTGAPNAEDDDFEGDVGSFFNFFTSASDPIDIGMLLLETILPDAVDYFMGTAEGCEPEDEDDEDDELDEESGDDDEEIDLENEKPSRKKRRVL